MFFVPRYFIRKIASLIRLLPSFFIFVYIFGHITAVTP